MILIGIHQVKQYITTNLCTFRLSFVCKHLFNWMWPNFDQWSLELQSWTKFGSLAQLGSKISITPLPLRQWDTIASPQLNAKICRRFRKAFSPLHSPRCLAVFQKSLAASCTQKPSICRTPRGTCSKSDSRQGKNLWYSFLSYLRLAPSMSYLPSPPPPNWEYPQMLEVDDQVDQLTF